MKKPSVTEFQLEILQYLTDNPDSKGLDIWEHLEGCGYNISVGGLYAQMDDMERAGYVTSRRAPVENLKPGREETEVRFSISQDKGSARRVELFENSKDTGPDFSGEASPSRS